MRLTASIARALSSPASLRLVCGWADDLRKCSQRYRCNTFIYQCQETGAGYTPTSYILVRTACYTLYGRLLFKAGQIHKPGSSRDYVQCVIQSIVLEYDM